MSIEFHGCTFESCDFSSAIFKKCTFIECKFIRCNLSVVDIGYSKFNDVVFEDCKVIGVDWTKADWSSLTLGAQVGFRRCVIDTSSFYGLDFRGGVIEECRAHDVDFREADIGGSTFFNTDLSGSQFRNTNLKNANFVEASNYDIDVNNNKIKKAKFSKFEALRLLESLEIDLVD